jgi:hypothetical protein
MFRSLILATALLFSTGALAQTTASVNPCDNIPEATKGKDSTTVNAILEACRVKDNVPNIVKQVANPETANTWASAAKGFGQAIALTAKELGVAANDFLNSPAGVLLALILLFNYAGGALLGAPVTIFSCVFWWWVVSKLRVDSIEYEFTPVLWGMFTIRRRKLVKLKSLADYDNGWWGGTATLLGIGLLIMNIVVWVNVT